MNGDGHISQRRLNALLAGLAALGAALILLAARGELWFDEVWSIKLAQALSSAAGIPAVRHDTNHLLNTFWVWLVGPTRNVYLYRLLSVASGLASLYLVDRIAARRGPWERFFALAFAATSYPLILYFTEARGYGPALLATFAAIYALLKWQERPGLTRAAAFWASVALGLASHATFLMVYLALFLFSGNIITLEVAPLKRKLWRFAALHAVPLAISAAFYLWFVQGIFVGGGTPGAASDAAPEFLLMLFGAPDAPWLRVFVYWPYLIGLAWTARAFYFKKRSEWLLFPIALLVAPGVMTLYAQGEFIYWRYYILCAPFALLMFAYLLGRLANRGRLCAGLALLALLAITAGQAARLYPLLKYGRSDYEGAIKTIAEKTTRIIATVTSNADNQNSQLVRFHAKNLGLADKVRYQPLEEGGGETAEFLLLRSTGEPEDSDVIRYVPGLGFYDFVSLHRYYGGISGWNLYLYKSK